MNISATTEAGRVDVTVLRVEGQLDGQSYQNLIAKARELFDEGARDFVLDLTDLTYISSAGLVALHSIALMLKGEEMPDTEMGGLLIAPWDAVVRQACRHTSNS